VVEEVSVLRLRHRPSQALHVQHVGEVEQRALDGGHRNPAAERDLLGRKPAAPMNPDAGAPNPPVLRRHRHIDQPGVALSQLPHLRAIAVRKHRTLPTRHYGGKPAPFDPQPIVADRVDTAVYAQQAPRANPFRNPVRAEAQNDQLPPRQNAPLARRDPLQPG
jgi:hypothetical protein